MSERKFGAPLSERPTIPAPKMEREPSAEHLKIESLSLEKEVLNPEAGEKRHNQDALFERLDEGGKTGTFGVFDGLGGAFGSDIASHTVADMLKASAEELEAIGKRRSSGDTSMTLGVERRALRIAMHEANESLLEMKAELPEQYMGMATTATIARLTKDEQGKYQAIVGHVGDSRAYLLHPNGSLETLTLDAHPVLVKLRKRFGKSDALHIQNILDELVDAREADALIQALGEGKSIPLGTGLTREDVEFLSSHIDYENLHAYFERREVLEDAIGYNPTVDMESVPVVPGSRLVLCTDGTDSLLKREIRSILRGRYYELPYKGVKEAVTLYGDTTAEALAFAARERGQEWHGRFYHPRSKGPDDTTVIVIDVPKR